MFVFILFSSKLIQYTHTVSKLSFSEIFDVAIKTGTVFFENYLHLRTIRSKPEQLITFKGLTMMMVKINF